MRVGADELAAEAMGDVGDGPTDVSGANDGEGASVEFGPDQSFDAEVVFAHPVAGLRDVAQQREQQREDVLCNTMRQVARYMNHREAKPPGCGQVDIVEAGAAQRHQSRATGLEGLERFGIEPIIEEGDHRRVPAPERGSGRVETRLNEGQLMTMMLIGIREQFAVKFVSAEHNGFHNILISRVIDQLGPQNSALRLNELAPIDVGGRIFQR